MEFLRKLFVQTQGHLRGLSVSQRLAIGSCVALIVVALLWMVNWASAPERVPLLDQSLTAEEMGRIQDRLSALGVDHKVSGDLILVPAASRARLLAQLEQGNLLPRDISLGFANLMEQSSPWLSQDEQHFRRSVALSNELSAVVGQFEGVQSARVFIDRSMKRMVGRPSVAPTASVFVRLEPGKTMDRKFVHAVANFVSRSVAGLDISSVGVTDSTTGRSFSVPRREDGLAFDDLEDRQKKEQYFAGKIRELLAHIPGVLVAVHAELSPESVRRTEHTVDRPVILEEETESTTQDRSRAGTGPGVNPNVSAAVGGAGTTDRTEQKRSMTRFTGEPSRTTTHTEKGRHDITGLSAAVIVPRSYLVGIYKQEHEGAEPTDAELEAATRESVLAKIERQVVRALDLTDPSQVEVEWFHDDAAMAVGFDLMQAGMGDGVTGFVRAHGAKAGLLFMAATSLLMMFMMVRKVGEGPVLPGEEPSSPGGGRGRGRLKGGESLGGGAAAVGDAHESHQLLEGIEVDQRTVRTQQMIDQIAGMVKEDPETAAGILQRWIDQGES